MMRFSIIYYLVSLLLVSHLVASKKYEPPSPWATPPRIPGYPDHGDIVYFQGPRGQHLSVVVGSQQHQGGNVNVAPLAPHSSLPPEEPVIAAGDHLVNTHPGNVARTRYRSLGLASSLQTYHQDNTPHLHLASGPTVGSPNHRATQRVHGGNRRGTRP